MRCNIVQSLQKTNILVSRDIWDIIVNNFVIATTKSVLDISIISITVSILF